MQTLLTSDTLQPSSTRQTFSGRLLPTIESGFCEGGGAAFSLVGNPKRELGTSKGTRLIQSMMPTRRNLLNRAIPTAKNCTKSVLFEHKLLIPLSKLHSTGCITSPAPQHWMYYITSSTALDVLHHQLAPQHWMYYITSSTALDVLHHQLHSTGCITSPASSTALDVLHHQLAPQHWMYYITS